MVRILLFKNGDRAFATDRVNSLTGFIVEHVITITDCGKALDGFSRRRIKHEQSRGVSSDYEQAMVGLVERHRIIRQGNVLDVVKQLDAVGIAVRGGDLASLPILKRMGMHEAIRASCYAYTSTEEIDRLIMAL